MKKFSNILWGLLFIFVGVIIGLNSFGITDINFFFDGWWTLFIIIPSTIEFFRSRNKVFNLIGIATGVALLLTCQGLLTFEMLWKLALPVILVIIGVALVFKDALLGKSNASYKRASSKKVQNDSHFAAFSTKNIKYDGQIFYGNDLTAVFGSVVCDLRNADFTEDVIINANVTFGGIEILLPEGIKADIKSTAIFGGVEDKRRNSAVLADSPTVFVSGLCLFGGVDIK